MKTPYDKLAKIYANYFGLAATPIYGKNPINLLLKNQAANDLWTWYVALGMWGLPSLFNDDHKLTLTYLMSRSNLLPYAFKWDLLKFDFF